MKEILNDKTIFEGATMFTLRYEDLSNWEVGKAVIEDAVNRWEPLGFLDGINDEKKKEQMAVAYDNMAHDLIFENEKVVNISNRYNFNCALDDEGKETVKFENIVLGNPTKKASVP